MLRFVLLVAVAVALVGCGGGFSPGQPPTTPDDYFTGEPTPTVIELQRQQAATASSVSAFALMAQNDETVKANIHIQRFTPANIVDYQQFLTIDVPKDAPLVELPIELPAQQRYQVTATIYDPNLTSPEGNYLLLEFGSKQQVDILAGATNRVTVTLGGLDYSVVAPAQLYSGGNLRQVDISVPRSSGFNDITRYYGLKPWSANSTAAFWAANGGHAGSGIPNTGWLNSGSAPIVNEPTTLYYQFRVCSPMQTATGTKHICAYIPDIDAGDSLFEITIYPSPTDG